MKPAPHERGDRFHIEGGRRLEGVVRVSGAKNAALPAFAAALLAADECVIENVPAIDDMAAMSEILRALGARVEQDATRPDVYRIDATGVRETAAPSRLVTAL